MNNSRVSLRLAVLTLVAGGITLGGMALACGPNQAPRSSNVNAITNVGSSRSTTVIVEPGTDGQLTRSVFLQNEPVPAVPAVPPMPMPMPEPVPVPPEPQPQPQPQPVEPKPVVPVPEIVIRIPVPQPALGRGPVVQIPGIRLPNIEIPPLEVPANRAIITNGPEGRTTIINAGDGRNTSIISSNGRTMVFGNGLCYTARDGRFWSKSMHSPQLDCTIYYDPRTTLWFRYCRQDGTYRPAPVPLDWDDE